MTRLVHALLIAVLAAALANAQSSTGRLAGTVLDPSRAAIPAAEVTVRSDATGAALELQTNTAGGFLAVSLLPGYYTVEVVAEGFKAYTVEAQKVDVARETSLPPIVLELGAASEVIVVEGGVSPDFSRGVGHKAVSCGIIYLLSTTYHDIGRRPYDYRVYHGTTGIWGPAQAASRRSI